MNFSRRIKEELVASSYPSACCKLACLSAFLRTSGSILTDGDSLGFSFSTESSSTAKYFKALTELMFDEEGRVSPFVGSGKEKYTVSFVSATTAGLLGELGILVTSPDGLGLEIGVDKYLVERECCKRAYVAGAFLGGGSCTLPSDDGGNRTGYHMEFVFSYYATASAFCSLLAEFEILAKHIERKGTHVVYIKNNDEIQELLTLIGAEACAYEVADLVIRKDFNNKVNRKLNCDLGNISKQIAAAERQKEAILLIDSTIGIDSLKDELAAVCRLRLSGDPLTLEEMAATLGVTKSCVNHRLRKIMEIARDLRA